MGTGFSVLEGGAGRQVGAPGANAYSALGAIHSGASSVTNVDVVNELQQRGYTVQVAHQPVTHHAPPAAPSLTKSQAISVAIDEALSGMSLPRTTQHPYHCPSSGGCGITANQWNTMVTWCVTVANGYILGQYGLPSWAATMLHSGTLSGAGGYGYGLGGLGDFSDWLQENDWLVTAVGGAIQSYGTHLTAKNVQDAIKANAAGQFTKADATALIAALQQQGAIPIGQGANVAAGANAAAGTNWMPIAMIIAGVVVVVMLMKK